MSIELNTTTAYLSGSLSGVSSSAWTLIVSSKYTNAADAGAVFRLPGTGGTCALLGYLNVEYDGVYPAGYGKDTTVVPSSSYEMLAITHSGTTQRFYSVRSGTATLIYTAAFGYSVAPTSVEFGASTTISAASVNSRRGKFAYAKMWKSTALSAAELEAEYPSAAPVKAGCDHRWDFASGALTDSIGGLTLTANGSTTGGTDDPSYISAGGSSVARLAAYYRMLRAA
jgi:hypothetical protein